MAAHDETTCRYLQQRGRVGRTYCPVRKIRQPTEAEHNCGPQCQQYRSRQHMATSGKIGWLCPANWTVPWAPDDVLLWQWAESEIAGGRSKAAVARDIGCADTTLRDRVAKERTRDGQRAAEWGLKRIAEKKAADIAERIPDETDMVTTPEAAPELEVTDGEQVHEEDSEGHVFGRLKEQDDPLEPQRAVLDAFSDRAEAGRPMDFVDLYRIAMDCGVSHDEAVWVARRYADEAMRKKRKVAVVPLAEDTSHRCKLCGSSDGCTAVVICRDCLVTVADLGDMIDAFAHSHGLTQEWHGFMQGWQAGTLDADRTAA